LCNKDFLGFKKANAIIADYEGEEEEEKDVDFDEVIIANTCDLIISFARAL
jgi:hypothetical protein